MRSLQLISVLCTGATVACATDHPAPTHDDSVMQTALLADERADVLRVWRVELPDGIVDQLESAYLQRKAAASAPCQDLFAQVDAAWRDWEASDEMRAWREKTHADALRSAIEDLRLAECVTPDAPDRQECQALFEALQEASRAAMVSPHVQALWQRPELTQIAQTIAQGQSLRCYDPLDMQE